MTCERVRDIHTRKKKLTVTTKREVDIERGHTGVTAPAAWGGISFVILFIFFFQCVPVSFLFCFFRVWSLPLSAFGLSGYTVVSLEQ